MLHLSTNPKKKIAVVNVILLLACLSLGATAEASYRIGEGDTYLDIAGLIQGWGTMTQDKAPDEKSMETEFYLRRMRFLASGQLNKWVNFFVETDSANFGKGGDLAVKMFIQDAYLEFNLHEMLQIDVGMMLLPFSHNGMQGAGTLLGIDYRVDMLRYPTGSHVVWRDFGVMARGMLFGKWLEYRLGIFNGVHGNQKTVAKENDAGNWTEYTDPRNPTDAPRLTARLTANIFDAEGGAGLGGFFYDGLYLKKTDAGLESTKKVLSIGASVDWQRKLNVTWAPVVPGGTPDDPTERAVDKREDYVAANADVFWDIPLDAAKLWSLNGQINFYYYNYGDRTDPNSWYNVTLDTKSYTGLGIGSEIGVRYDAFQPLFMMDWYNSEGALDAAGQEDENVGDMLGLYGGFNWWVFAHAASLKVQFGANKVNHGDFGMAGVLQAQLLF